jgi:Tfp pilus assembly protein PilV
MAQLWKRLANKTGESLVETLAAMLIFTLGSIIMLSYISTATNINQITEEVDNRYYADVITAELANVASEETSAVRFLITGSNLNQTVTVNVYGNRDGLYTYYAEGDGS